jgi:hypothetical protein
MLIPCQLAAEQISALCNTMPGAYPARPIMSGRMCIDLLVIPVRQSPPSRYAFDAGTCVLSFDQERAGGRVELVTQACPAGKPGDELWLQEALVVQEVFGTTGVRVSYTDAQQSRIIYLTEGDASYRPGQKLVTPSIEWARADRLLVRDVAVCRLERLTESDARRAGAPAAEPCNGHRGLGRSHLRGLQLWWDAWFGLGNWVGGQDRLCWLVGIERNFADD